MKKLLFALFLLFSISTFSWESLKLKDEFGDDTGQIAMVKMEGYVKGMRLIKDEGKVWLDVMIGPRATVGEMYPLKMKIDGGEVIQVIGLAVTDRLIRLAIADDIMDKIKKGNKLAIVASNEDGGNVNLITSLSGFTNAYNRVK